MPWFRVNASDVNGKVFHDTFFAADKPALIQQLQHQGIFLVSCTEAESDAEPSTPEAPASAEPSPSTRPGAWDLKRLPPPTRRENFGLVAILLSGLLVGSWRTYQHRYPVIRNDILEERMSHLRTGMTRTDVEKVLGGPVRGGAEASQKRYFLPPHWIVQISYVELKNTPNPTPVLQVADIKVLKKGS